MICFIVGAVFGFVLGVATMVVAIAGRQIESDQDIYKAEYLKKAWKERE